MDLGKSVWYEYSTKYMTINDSFDDKTQARSTSFTEDLKKTFESFESHPEAEALKKSAHQIADTVTEFIQEHPLQTVLGATAVGFLLGFFAGRKK